MKKLVTLIALTLLSFNVQSADVSVNACVSATVISQSHPGVINGFEKQCINLSGSAIAPNPNESAYYSESDVLQLAWGGCNTTGVDFTFTIEFEWQYDITTVAAADESASGWVKYSLAPQPYRSGSGSFSKVFNDTIVDQLCVDGLVEMEVSAHARSGPLSTAIPGPGILLTLLAFLSLIFFRRKQLQRYF